MIHNEGAQHGPTLYLAATSSRYLHQGCYGFVAYVMDTQEKGEVTIYDVPIVRDVLMEDLPGVPLERQVEFRIDFLGAAPIAKAPYQLAPPEVIRSWW